MNQKALLPYEADEIRIAPAQGQVRRIYGDPVRGLLFEDPIVGVVPLSAVGAWRAGPGWALVGPGGYPEISHAIDSLRTQGGGSVLVLPGRSKLPSQIGPGQFYSLSYLGDHPAQAGTGMDPALAIQGAIPNQAGVEIFRGRFVSGLNGPAILAQSDRVDACLVQIEDCKFSAEPTSSQPAIQAENSHIQVARSRLEGAENLHLRGCQVEISDSVLMGSSALVGSGSIQSCQVHKVLDLQGQYRVGASQLDTLVIRSGSQVTLQACEVARLEVQDGATLQLSGTQLGDVKISPGAVVDHEILTGEVAFSGLSSMVVQFGFQRPSSDYVVGLTLTDRPAGDEIPWVSGWDRSGFEIQFLGAQTLRVQWVLHRQKP